jgi:hypothetical protein
MTEQKILGETRLILSMVEARALFDAVHRNDVTQQTKIYRQITGNHAEVFWPIILHALNVGDVDASNCPGFTLKQGVPRA